MRLLSCRNIHSIAHKVCMNSIESGPTGSRLDWGSYRNMRSGGLLEVLAVNKYQKGTVPLVHSTAALMIGNMMK